MSRALVAASLIGCVLTGAPAAALAQSVSVNLNGQALAMNPGPIERAGRVFVPLRGIFERLGASVVYSSGTINATRGGTTVSLTIGSTQATVNGQTQTLDVAPFIVGSTTYVPLRFVAQSLGAQVGYESSTNTVSIVSSGPAPPPPNPPMPPPNPPSSVIRLRAQQPAPDAQTSDRFAAIAAEFSHRVNPGSVRIWIDGTDITTRSGLSPTGFSYRPPAPLEFGTRTVRVSGRDATGARFERSWSFTVVRSGPVQMRLTINQPPANSPVGSTFVVQGNTIPLGRVAVTAGATPSSMGQFRGSTTAGQQGNFRITVSLNRLIGQQSVMVRVRVSDPSSSQTTERTLQLRLR